MIIQAGKSKLMKWNISEEKKTSNKKGLAKIGFLL
jgi:hypothetical protein